MTRSLLPSGVATRRDLRTENGVPPFTNGTKTLARLDSPEETIVDPTIDPVGIGAQLVETAT